MTGRIILVVDDDKFMRVAVCDSLKDDGYELVEAEHGDAALAQLDRISPDLVILDLFMPQKSGLETLGEIRKRDPELPVLILSSLDTTATIEEAIRLGATDFISKPFHPMEISLAVRKVVRA